MSNTTLCPRPSLSRPNLHMSSAVTEVDNAIAALRAAGVIDVISDPQIRTRSKCAARYHGNPGFVQEGGRHRNIVVHCLVAQSAANKRAAIWINVTRSLGNKGVEHPASFSQRIDQECLAVGAR